jgi:S1-C subfamily serine protease
VSVAHVAIGALFLLLIQQPSRIRQTTLTTAEIYKGAVDAVVQIETLDSSGRHLAMGSGFILSPDGLIATNHHVIDGFHTANIRLASGATFPLQEVVADDAEQDLALIQVRGRNLPFLTLRLTDPEVGERVVVIGSPLGLQNSVSDGVVSGLRKGSQDWIQYTAASSSGNSGGPLLDDQKRVIGVVTLKLTRGENLNFAASSKALSALMASPRHVGIKIETKPESSLWTSLVSNKDYKIRFEDDFIYVEWVNLPAEVRDAAFMKAEFKKGGSAWIGKARVYHPFFSTWTGVKWCSLEFEMTLIKVSSKRIEGSTLSWDKFDVGKCKPKDARVTPFTWIPKGND